MIVVPVMDLRHGACVHAKAGQRAEYRPLESSLTPRASEPLELAAAYHNRIGADRIYVADLDAIMDDRPNWNVLRALSKSGAAIWADVGVRTALRAVTAFEAGIETIVLGLETLAGPASLREILRGSSLPRDRFILSLDLFDGRPLLAPDHTWPDGPTLENVVEVASELGVKRFLILDLARVGVGRGVGGREWVESVAGIVPKGEIWLGGGVRGQDDLEDLRKMPIAGVLVGSALHSGAIGRDDIASLARNTP
jgi:phosphoribosylformimino-5-aminoimidazole carboxamide ribotide isomerase